MLQRPKPQNTQQKCGLWYWQMEAMQPRLLQQRLGVLSVLGISHATSGPLAFLYSYLVAAFHNLQHPLAHEHGSTYPFKICRIHRTCFPPKARSSFQQDSMEIEGLKIATRDSACKDTCLISGVPFFQKSFSYIILTIYSQNKREYLPKKILLSKFAIMPPIHNLEY